jgi:hypothetical protein
MELVPWWLELRIPLGAEAPVHLTGFMYGLKRVPFTQRLLRLLAGGVA